MVAVSDPLRPPAKVAWKLAGGGVLVAIVIVAYVALQFRRAPDVVLTGMVEKIPIPEATNSGVILRAFVRMKDGSLILINLPDRHNCAVGMSAQIRRSTTVLGYRYDLSFPGCRISNG
jgi:hypothetical protein